MHSLSSSPTSASKKPLLTLSHALKRGPAAARVRLSLAAFAFHSLKLHDERGTASLKDYVRECLGRSLSSYYDWSHAGRLFASSPRARCAARSGALPFSSAVLLGRRSRDEALDWVRIASGIPTADLKRIFAAASGHSEYEELPEDRRQGLPDPSAADADTASSTTNVDRTLRLRLRLPRTAAAYCNDTLDLARAQLGHDASCADALSAVIAEASTEIDTGSSTGFTAPRCLQLVGVRRSRSSSAQPKQPWPTPRTPADRRRLAQELDRILCDCLSALDRYRIQSEELLLELYHGPLPPDAGGRNFYKYCEDVLDLKRSTAHEMLVRAQLRRRDHPIEVARALGRLCPNKINLIARLPRLGVPQSALASWIDLAARATVRHLRRMLAAIKRLGRTDLRAWAKNAYRPLSETEIRTSETPLEEIAAQPEPPHLESLLQEPSETLDWNMHGPDHLLLVEMLHHVDVETHALQARSSTTSDRSWWPLLRVFHFARHAWRHAAQAMPKHPHKKVLERDRYSCQVPGCSQRAVEVHHITFRSQGGSDEPENLLCLCNHHHRHGVHEGRIRIQGRVTEERDQLQFEMPFGTFQGEFRVSAS